MAKRTAALALAVGLVGGGLIGGMFGLPNISGAQSTTTPPSSPTSPDQSQATSNEDPSHEATESPEREAEEDSGHFQWHHHGSNEDPAHEATESPEREAQEDSGSGSGSQTPPSSTGPATSGASIKA
jgi:hypothetical protein